MSEDTETFEPLGTASRPAVGVPTHELALHKALNSQFGRLFRPGSGRSVFLLQEAELGFGRPDGLVLAVSAIGLKSFVQRGLRLPSLAAARSLTGDSSNVSEKHSRHLLRRLEEAGWTNRDLVQAAALVHDAIAIEAKMSDWKAAIRQASRYKVGAGRAAVLLPHRIGTLVEPRNLLAHGVGLLVEERQKIQWATPAPSSEASPAQRAWLLELLIRGLENGEAQRAT